MTTVMNFAELKAAVEDSVTAEILLGADITFSGGIKIPTAKKTLTIDGGGFTITDNNSSSYTDAIYVPAGAGSATVTVRNAVWSGRNYYGIVCVYDDSANAGVEVILDGIRYKGPQMIYNRYGSTVVRNCDISIEKNSAGASAQEFCEGNRIKFEGKVEVTCSTAANAVIWFPFAGSAFTVADAAVLTINAPNTYAFYTDTAAKPAFRFGANSSTRISTKNGLFYASGTGAHIASSCKLDTGATLYVTASANSGVPLFKCGGEFTVEENASLFLVMPTKGSSPLLYFSSAAVLTFNSPKNVLLYSDGGKVFSFATGSASSPNVVKITAKQVNYWSLAKTPFASAGGFDDKPSLRFAKADADIGITQRLTTNAVVSTSGNITAEDEGYPLDGSTFDLTKAAVLSFGNLGLTINKINDLSTSVSGTTDGDASVIYEDSLQTVDGTASPDGEYSLATDKKPVAGDTATVKVNKNFLTVESSVTIGGSVSVSYLPDIPFNAFVSPKGSAKVKRIDPEWHLVLTDTRPEGGRWSLYLSLKTPLASGENTIENAVAFATDSAVSTVGETRMLVAEGMSDGAGAISVGWGENFGVILALSDETEYEKGDYSSSLGWSVDFE